MPSRTAEKKTAGVYDLVASVLKTFQSRYSEDVIEDVFFAIEQNPVWLRQYRDLSDDLRQWVVTNWVGHYTKQLTGMKVLRVVSAKRGTLIKGFSKLTQ
ncbi:MAG: hypothetical protein H0X37_11125 [Herpetosiphonaceae bacterium]|nr:hypothetical protein [Herpetosiphonaceae bacterium]